MLDLFNMEAIEHCLRYSASFAFEGHLFNFIDPNFSFCTTCSLWAGIAQSV